MYPVSEAYKTAIRARTRTDRVTGTLTLTDGTVLPLTAAELMSGSLTLDNQCVTGEELAFGCAYLGQAALNLRTALSRHAFYGARLCLAYGLQLPDGQWEEVPLGSYTVAEAERRALYVSIKAYDNLLALQRRYDGTVLQGTASRMTPTRRRTLSRCSTVGCSCMTAPSAQTRQRGLPRRLQASQVRRSPVLSMQRPTRPAAVPT